MFRSFIVAAVLGLTTLFSCQQASTEGDATTTQAQTSVTADTVQTQRRPAPAFHKIPTELAKTRVYICTDSSADTFHKKHDCEVLIQCKAMFRNVTLLRAVEDYDRYNCEVCSKDLAFVFEEGNVN